MGVLERVKVVAEQKKSDISKAAEKEKRYQAYKHPDAAYIAGGSPKSSDYEETSEFAERENRERAGRIEGTIKRRAAVRSAGTKVVGFVKEKFKKKPAARVRYQPRRRAAPADSGWGWSGAQTERSPAASPLGQGALSFNWTPEASVNPSSLMFGERRRAVPIRRRKVAKATPQTKVIVYQGKEYALAEKKAIRRRRRVPRTPRQAGFSLF